MSTFKPNCTSRKPTSRQTSSDSKSSNQMESCCQRGNKLGAKPKQPCKKPPKTPSGGEKAFINLEHYESLLDENGSLECDRFRLQEKLLEKENSFSDLEEKFGQLQCQLMKVCKDNKFMQEKLSQKVDGEMKSKLESYVNNTEKLACCIGGLESQMSVLQHELNFLKSEKKISQEFQSSDAGCQSQLIESQTEKQLERLKSQYANLQVEYCRKEKECKERFKGGFNCNEDDERAVNDALEHRAGEMAKEIEDYKVFIKELQEQVDEYREKFMKAQEKVEYQRFMLENLELNNQQVESQINDEISRIKEKFQEKLNELCPFPKMLEESEVELEQSKARIISLEDDLKATVAALGNAKSELAMLKKQQPDESLEIKSKKLQIEVDMLKKKVCGAKATKECLEEKLSTMQKELEELRSYSTQIIAATKCGAEKKREILHQHINNLEVELSQSRAAAAMSLTAKEETIKKMKLDLTALCSSFNDCQQQIKQLKNQVSYLTNQRHDIRPQDLHSIDFCYPEF